MPPPRPSDALHVFRVDLPIEDARHLLTEDGPLRAALGAERIDTDRAEIIDPADLAGIGLASYLTEGQGADPDAVRADAQALDGLREPVLILLPRALGSEITALYPKAPLRLVGSYPLVRARPAEGGLTAPGGDGLVTGAPPQATDRRSDRRAGGYVALVALAVALLVALVVWIAAT